MVGITWLSRKTLTDPIVGNGGGRQALTREDDLTLNLEDGMSGNDSPDGGALAPFTEEGRCFTADSGGAVVGLAAPADPCASPFSEPRDGGYEVIELAFNDFNAGEEFTFSVDVDPTSIKGYAGAGGAGSVSGLELTGAQATVGFDVGGTQTAQTFRIPASVSDSYNTLKANPPAKPAIEVVGVQAPAKVPNAQQTVRVSGPAGSSVSLMVLEGGVHPAFGWVL